MEGALTPADMFFIRDHFTEPDLSLEDWTLQIDGLVQRPCELNFSDLLEAASTKLEAVLECAGNKAAGSAASNGNWEGVTFKTLLQTAGLQPNARFVLLEAADRGKLFPDIPDAPYVQVVPLAKCLHPSSIVAYRLNGRFLPKGNGFPARALFPGWYAMDSVKWLRRIVVLSDDAGSEFSKSGMDRLYNRTLTTNAGFESVRLAELQVKSAIAWPANAGSQDVLKLPAGKHTVWGFAWTGEGKVRTVSVSVNGGKDLEPRPARPRRRTLPMGSLVFFLDRRARRACAPEPRRGRPWTPAAPRTRPAAKGRI